jgi:hypothetical protein
MDMDRIADALSFRQVQPETAVERLSPYVTPSRREGPLLTDSHRCRPRVCRVGMKAQDGDAQSDSSALCLHDSSKGCRSVDRRGFQSVYAERWAPPDPPFPPRLSITPMFSGDKAKIGLVLCLNDPRLSKTSHRHPPSLSCILAFWILYYSTPYTLTCYLYTYITYLLNMATGRLRLANKVSSCWKERNELIARFASSLVLDRKSYRRYLILDAPRVDISLNCRWFY